MGEEPSAEVRPSGDARTPIVWRFPVIGLVLGMVLAGVGAALGADGRVGFVVVVLVTAAGCGLGATYALLTAVIDDLRSRPVARSRPVSGVALFLAAAVLMALVAGAGG